MEINIADKLFLASQWLFHIYDGFPRRLLFITRQPDDSLRTTEIPEITNKGNYSQLIDEHFLNSSCYVSVYPKVELFNKIYIDFDKETNLAEAYKDVGTTIRFFKQKYNYTPRVYFTGAKGFALYIDFYYTKLRNVQSTIRAYVRNLQNNLALTTVDWATIGDKNRVSRIPYTINVTTRNLCIPIDSGWALGAILEASRTGSVKISIENLTTTRCAGLSEELGGIDKRMENIPRSRWQNSLPTSATEDINFLKRLRIVNSIFKNAKLINDYRHRILFSLLIPHLTWTGFDLETIQSMCAEWLRQTPEEGRKPIEHYLNYIDAIYKRTLEGQWEAWTIKRFLMDYPETSSYFEEPI